MQDVPDIWNPSNETQVLVLDPFLNKAKPLYQIEWPLLYETGLWTLIHL